MIAAMKLSAQQEVLNVLSEAACTSADPHLMVSRDIISLVAARQFCNACPVKRGCLDLVQPRASFFDGTAGGRSWNNGRDITSSVNKLVAYTQFFTFRTRKVRLLSVKLVMQGRYPVSWLNKDEKMLLAFVSFRHDIDVSKIAKWIEVPVAAIAVIYDAVNDGISANLRYQSGKLQFNGRNVKKNPIPSQRESDPKLLKERVQLVAERAQRGEGRADLSA